MIKKEKMLQMLKKAGIILLALFIISCTIPPQKESCSSIQSSITDSTGKVKGYILDDGTVIDITGKTILYIE